MMRSWLGIDYHAIRIVAPGAGEPALDAKRIAAFETPAHRDPFVAWLGKRGVRPQIAARAGREFVVWESPEDDLLQQYRGDMLARCTADYHKAVEKAAPAIVRNPC